DAGEGIVGAQIDKAAGPQLNLAAGNQAGGGEVEFAGAVAVAQSDLGGGGHFAGSAQLQRRAAADNETATGAAESIGGVGGLEGAAVREGDGLVAGRREQPRPGDGVAPQIQDDAVVDVYLVGEGGPGGEIKRGAVAVYLQMAGGEVGVACDGKLAAEMGEA